ncbi:monooxygenase [Oceanobacillus senegalensis]|uniref:monooxygenase n=1 Tax=Oceanobacillus senegalensis TaxID=1936063 RepID=UPI000A30F380|nr:monooxygenase [Oceanobacillus senegalensis]
MIYLLQVDFKMDGPFGEEMANAFMELAKSINEEPGFIRKIWTENAEDNEAGGIYLFETKEDAKNYLTMHSERLKSFGIQDIRAKIFEINETLTSITKGLTK